MYIQRASVPEVPRKPSKLGIGGCIPLEVGDLPCPQSSREDL